MGMVESDRSLSYPNCMGKGKIVPIHLLKADKGGMLLNQCVIVSS